MSKPKPKPKPKPKYKLGDTVEVIDAGKTYSTFEEMAKKLGVTGAWRKGERPHRGWTYAVVGSEWHDDRYVYAIMGFSGYVYLIGEDGLDITTLTIEEVMTMSEVIGTAVMDRDFASFKKGETLEVLKEGTNVILVNRPATGDQLTIPRKLLVPGSLSVTPPTGVGSGLSAEEASILGGILGTTEFVSEDKTPKAPEPIVLGPNQVLFSSLTGGRLPASKIDHIIDTYPEDHFPEEIRCDIPEGDPNYHWDVGILELLVLGHQLNKKVLITGLPGTGKSSAIRQFASIIGQPYMRFNGKDGIEPSSFLGYPWAGKEGMVWKDGLLPIGCKEGYLVTIDEVFKLNAGIQMAMQCLYEDGGHLLLDDKPGSIGDKKVVPHNDFRLFMTDNVKGTGDNLSMFAATQMQDTSTLDRFALVGELGYLEDHQEVGLLKAKYPTMLNTVLKSMVKVAELIRNGYRKGEISVTLSPRGLFTICELMGKGVDLKTAITYSFTNKLGEDDEKRAVEQIFRTVGV